MIKQLVKELKTNYIAICLLLILTEDSSYTSICQLSEILKCTDNEIIESLELLRKHNFLSFKYNSKKLMNKEINIYLNQNKINIYNQKSYSKNVEYIYVIRKDESNYYKIGRTNNIERRIKQLQTSNSEILYPVKIIKTKGAAETETAIHKKYKHHQVNGEWFFLKLNVLEELFELLDKLGD